MARRSTRIAETLPILEDQTDPFADENATVLLEATAEVLAALAGPTAEDLAEMEAQDDAVIAQTATRVDQPAPEFPLGTKFILAQTVQENGYQKLVPFTLRGLLVSPKGPRQTFHKAIFGSWQAAQSARAQLLDVAGARYPVINDCWITPKGKLAGILLLVELPAPKPIGEDDEPVERCVCDKCNDSAIPAYWTGCYACANTGVTLSVEERREYAGQFLPHK